jgi:bifunctional ADP-heptose synthase (sugar kinase/adenylyltransferase)
VSEHYSTHLLRADWELAKPVEKDKEQALIDHVLEALPKAGAVVLSDYAKGVLTPHVIRAGDRRRHKGRTSRSLSIPRAAIIRSTAAPR